MGDTDFSHMSWEKFFYVLLQILLKFIYQDAGDSKSALIRVIAWHQKCCKPLSPRPTVVNSCANQYEWHSLRMEVIFFLKNLEFIPGLPLCRTRTIWYDDYLRIRHELNTNWHDAVRCNKTQHDGDTMQYDAVRWWWRINSIALWCDENTIETYTNQCEHVRSDTTMRSLRIVLQRTESQQTDGESQCECITNKYECTTMRHEPIGTDTNWYDVWRCNMTQ